MITLNEAKQILHGQILRTRDQLIVLLAILPVQALSLDKIKARCVEAGLPKLARKNISDILSKSNGLVARTAAGWELQNKGIHRVQELRNPKRAKDRQVPRRHEATATSLAATVEDIMFLLSAFPDCVGYSRNRRASPILLVNTEADVQDLIYFMLRPAIGDLLPERPIANTTRQYSLEDYLCRNLRTIIEAKLVRSKAHGRTLKKELHDDIGEYKADPACEHLIFFIYDPNKHIESSTGLKRAIEGVHGHNGKTLNVYCVIDT